MPLARGRPQQRDQNADSSTDALATVADVVVVADVAADLGSWASILSTLRPKPAETSLAGRGDDPVCWRITVGRRCYDPGSAEKANESPAE